MHGQQGSIFFGLPIIIVGTRLDNTQISTSTHDTTVLCQTVLNIFDVEPL